MRKLLPFFAAALLTFTFFQPAAGADAPEYLILPVSARDEAIGGFEVSASGGGQTLSPDPAKTLTDGGQYTYYLPFENPPQEDTDFTITVTSRPKGLFAGLRRGAGKTVTMTYNAIKSLTVQSPDGAVQDGVLYLWSDSVPGRRSVSLAAQKNPGAEVTGPTGHPYMKVQNYTAPVSWASSDEAVCTVDSSGLLTAVGGGKATVTASVYGGRVTAAVTVAVDACPPDDSGNAIAPGRLGQTVNWAGRSWWLIDEDGTQYGGRPGSVVLLSGSNYATSTYGGTQMYKDSRVRTLCGEFFASLPVEKQTKISPHIYNGDRAWLPSVFEIWKVPAGSRWSDDYPQQPPQFSWFQKNGVTSAPASCAPVHAIYGAQHSWLHSRAVDNSIALALVYGSNGQIGADYINESYGVRPAIILNP